MANLIKVLSVDDEEQMFLIMKLTVGPLGFDFSYAPNDVDIPAMIQDNNIDVAVIDYLMPGKNGLIVADEIRQKIGNDFPIVFLTSKELDENETKKLMSLKLEYMRKPFIPQILSAKLQQLVSNKS
jgi:DNA-binding response OmpR family regulator